MKNPSLLVSKQEFVGKLSDQLDKAKDFLTYSDKKEMYKDFKKWSDYTSAFLKQSFYSDNYSGNLISKFLIVSDPTSLMYFSKFFSYIVENSIICIESIIEQSEFYEEKSEQIISLNGINSKKVFIVHGHDEGMMHHVARIIEKESDYEAVILSEKPNEGQTVIEKFEKQAKEAGFAIILMSPDDVGNSKKEYGDKNLLNDRARQNVLFEFGFFTGFLGRERIVVIYKEGVEIPSDLNGVIYLNYDKDDWKSELMKEIKNLEVKSCS